MGIKETLGLLMELFPDIKEVKKTHGVVHKRRAAEINGVKGFLVWDYIIWNEITFDDEDGNIYSCFNSISDKETEQEWDELVGRYGV